MSRKPKTIARLLDDCAVVLQKIVRMKAAIHAKSPVISCVTCGKKRHLEGNARRSLHRPDLEQPAKS